MAKKNDTPSAQETKEQEKQVEEQEAQALAEQEPTEFYSVKVNPALPFTDRVSIYVSGESKIFYADETRNRDEGTPVVDDVQWETIKEAKDPDEGVAYIVKSGTL